MLTGDQRRRYNGLGAVHFITEQSQNGKIHGALDRDFDFSIKDTKYTCDGQNAFPVSPNIPWVPDALVM
jgi:hypothetical protein